MDNTTQGNQVKSSEILAKLTQDFLLDDIHLQYRMLSSQETVTSPI